MKKFVSVLMILAMMASMLCISTSAAGGVHINCNFDNADTFHEQFIAGNFYIEDGLLYGYNEARALHSKYFDQNDDNIIEPMYSTWLTYDAKVSVNIGDDDLDESHRSISILYCNDSVVYMGRETERVFMSFCYDIDEGCFRFTKGWEQFEDNQILEPVYMDIDIDNNTFVTFGMSVEKNRIRCFYNDELIFDFNDNKQEWLIGHYINSPLLVWQRGNFVQFDNITVADAAYLYPHETVEDGTTTTTTVDGNVNDTTSSIETSTTTPRVTTTSQKVVEITNDKGETVTDDKGEAVTSISIITEAPAPADTNTGKPNGGSSSSTGDATFVVIAAMVATLGCAVIVRKVSCK